MKSKLNITSKVPSSGTSIFAVMSKMAKDYNAINLSQGFPGYSIDPELIRLVQKYMNEGFNQYAPMPGVLELREAISQMHYNTSAVSYNPENEITITAGATQGLYSSISALISEGDEVIVFEPAYDSYVPVILANRGIPIQVQLKQPDYHIDWKEVNKLINAQTKMIIINNPHNPTGAVLNSSDIKELSKLVKGTNIIVLSDEVYQHIIFDNKKHMSLAEDKELAQHSIIIGSFGKTLHATGWKCGYILAPKAITQIIRELHQWVVFAVNTPIQYAIAEYLQKQERYLQVSHFLEEKRNYFLKLLKGSNFIFTPTQGTYFQLLNYNKISTKNDIEFTEWLTKEKKVAAIPVSVFYHEKTDHKVIRFCFAKENEELEKAAELLQKL
jgi:methionine aminotransferase